MKIFTVPFKIIIVFVTLIIHSENASAQYKDCYGWGLGPGMMGWWGLGWFGPLLMMIFWGLILVLIFLLIRRLLSSTHSGTNSAFREESALDILKKRYARGEIDKEEFETKKKDLS